MSTRSFIGLVNSDGSVKAIYCHSDGYLSHNGQILLDHYKESSKVEELIALGDISCLGEEIGEKHPFDGPSFMDERAYEAFREKYGKMCRVYHRDREEPFREPVTYKDEQDYFAQADEIAYLFKDGQWLHRDDETREVHLLADAIKDENAKEAE